ncbi:hypothetical protein Tco_1496253 [Tanacetum coccineum]
MSHSTIPIPSDSTEESVESSPSLIILLDTEAEVTVIADVLLEIAPAATSTTIVAPPTTTLDLVIESNPEVEPSKAPPSEEPPSPDYVPSYPIYAPASPDYHPRLDTESEPIEDISEPIEDTRKAAKPPPTQRCRCPPPAPTVPPPDVPLPTPITEAVILEFIIREATNPVALVRHRRLVHLDGQIEEIHSHQREVSVARIKSDEQEIKTLLARAMWVEAQVVVLRGLHGIFRVRIMDLEFRVEDAEDRLEQCEHGWIHDKARIRRLEEHLGIRH